MAANMQNQGARRGNPWRLAIWGFAGCLLLLPLVAMQFTDEVNWTGSDFAVFGAMLAIACGAYEFAARMSGSKAYRAGAGIAVAAGFLLVWVNLAVGIIQDTAHPANLMFVGVLMVGIAGALVARFRPRGMARALVATAAAQGLAGAIGLVFFRAEGPQQAMALFVLTGFLAAMWLVSAWLFRKSA